MVIVMHDVVVVKTPKTTTYRIDARGTVETPTPRRLLLGV